MRLSDPSPGGGGGRPGRRGPPRLLVPVEEEVEGSARLGVSNSVGRVLLLLLRAPAAAVGRGAEGQRRGRGGGGASCKYTLFFCEWLQGAERGSFVVFPSIDFFPFRALQASIISLSKAVVRSGSQVKLGKTSLNCCRVFFKDVSALSFRCKCT